MRARLSFRVVNSSASPPAPLDGERALAVMRILDRLVREFQTAIIVVTHDEKIIPTFRRIHNIRDGKTYEEVGEGRET